MFPTKALLSGWGGNDVTGNIDQGLTSPALASQPAFPPFKFEPRRTRIDWRLLHGVDINNIVSVMSVHRQGISLGALLVKG
eukprot:1159300-Pelagomonas_calceolata.AAC.7